ncbi:lipid IV(A) 3-deoxy-D-manno-octulosonic acid transferase [Lonepinella sp. BR2357]|uniref:lipid IV(A) 3-deoxy-D-manno-octulosonic acid transferase n=1 Tax=Lonepinella sp. BR2357 TaxID=3434549 RepID=UPI003F6E2A3A
MLRWLYTLAMYVLQPFLLLFMWGRSIKSPNYRKRLWERYGLFYAPSSQPRPHGIVIHAASVGEVIAATPLVRQIQAEYPQLPITMTTVTPTGSARVKAAFGDSVRHFYLPYDLPGAVKRFIQFVQPKACIVIETEIWPTLIHQLKLRHIPFIVANARLSARSARRYAWAKNRIKNVLNEISLIAPQDSISGQRYTELGYRGRLELTGNIKYDLVISEELLNNIQQLQTDWIGQRPVWIAGSTHEGEEEIVLQAHRTLLQQFPDLLLILAPRHPERFNSVANLIEKHNFRYCRRSNQVAPSSQIQILLGDTMGELMLMYGVSDVAFVGGSLVKHGGHNPLEPLAFKLPVISGVHVFNFPEVFLKLEYVLGVLKVKSEPKILARAVSKFLRSPKLRQRFGQAGYEVLVENRGALKRLIGLLRPYLEQQSDTATQQTEK